MRLRHNPEPLAIVSGGLREAFKPYRPPPRCGYVDGRGQCRADAVGQAWHGRYVVRWCERHKP